MTHSSSRHTNYKVLAKTILYRQLSSTSMSHEYVLFRFCRADVILQQPQRAYSHTLFIKIVQGIVSLRTWAFTSYRTRYYESDILNLNPVDSLEPQYLLVTRA